MNKNELYRLIPKVDVQLDDEKIKSQLSIYDRKYIVDILRSESDRIRRMIDENHDEENIRKEIEDLSENAYRKICALSKPHLKRVINATGTILHTNLGRAPISKTNAEHLADLMSDYSNLEYDLEKGSRGERYDHFADLICKITGAEAALAVNNNAAAVMLILHALGKDKEIIVSRGELVEVGGSFRIPDVMSISKARLIEVGTTNKTHLRDYEEAINENTAALMKVHTSNYRVMGFTESVTSGELKDLVKDKDIPVIEDLGSGALLDLSEYGLDAEPTVSEVIASGIDVVCFSGDKMLGGPQAGIIAGKKKYIDIIKKDQLLRALRIDKFTTATLELTLMEYLKGQKAAETIPFLKHATSKPEDIRKKADKLIALLKGDADFEVIGDEGQIGGGSMPLVKIPTFGVAVAPHKMSTASLEKKLRSLDVPVISRIFNDRVFLDMLAIDEEQIAFLAEEINSILV